MDSFAITAQRSPFCFSRRTSKLHQLQVYPSCGGRRSRDYLPKLSMTCDKARPSLSRSVDELRDARLNVDYERMNGLEDDLLRVPDANSRSPTPEAKLQE